PVIADRAQQQRVRNALEPEWEARLDRRQYGFRPGRGCHDAIEMIHNVLAGKKAKREWVLDADLKSAFDRIDHEFLLERIGTFPARKQIRGWLNAGVVDRGRYSPTTEGTPQGGLCAAAHNPPYEQCWVMCSAWRLPLVGAVAAVGRCA
ncbi:MAG: group II intron reverse transcriptase domain-containing protein, partial [Pseudonocardia sp.]|nr:group II intron reverse transcriptase domain-containing protein [Pseudonocardia sp.]